MQGKLEDEQHRHNYQSQLNEIKTLCDKSFTSIEESHAKQVNIVSVALWICLKIFFNFFFFQLEDLQASHKREMDRLVEEHSSELDTNREDTRRVVEAMRKVVFLFYSHYAFFVFEISIFYLLL